MDGFEMFLALVVWGFGAAAISAIAAALIYWQFDITYLKAFAGCAAATVIVMGTRLITK